MAINPSRIAAGSTVTREQVNTTILDIWRGVPSSSGMVYFWNRDREAWEYRVYDNSYPSNQLIAVLPANSNIATLYLLESSSNSWKPVAIYSSVTDPGTGGTWNPLAPFYTPLAS